MPRKRLILETIDPASERGQKLLRLDDTARDIRGRFLDLAVRIEQTLSWIIAMYFCPQEERRRDLYELILHRGPPYVRFGSKIEVLKGILALSHPEAPKHRQSLTQRLIDINAFRNKIAHWPVDPSDESLERGQEGEIQLIPYEGSGRKPVRVTMEDATTKQKEWLETYRDLVQVGNEVLRRASGEGLLPEIETLVQNILNGCSPPWPAEITDLVFLAIENDRARAWMYSNVVRALDAQGKRGQQIVNQYIGKRVKRLTTGVNRGRCYSPRSSLIQSYEKH